MMMKSHAKFGSALCALVVLSSCGGGGSGGSGGSAPPISLPSPTPTPAPAPAPTPAPSPTYALATDFTADRDYPGWGVEVVEDYTAPVFGTPPGTLGTTRYAVNLANETRAAGFTYRAATNTYTVRWFDLTKDYGPARDFLFQERIPISQIGDFNRAPGWTNDLSTDYTRYFGAISWQETNTNGNAAVSSLTRRFVSLYGVTTIPSDLPETGIANFRFSPFVGAWGRPVLSNRVPQDGWMLSVDWATGAITGSLTISPASDAPAGSTAQRIMIEGNVDKARSRLQGRFFSPLSGLSGSFVGAVFGPRGRELGFAYRIEDVNANGLAGGTGYSGVNGGRQLGF